MDTGELDQAEAPRAAPPGERLGWWAGISYGLPRPFWILLAGTFVNRIGYLVEPFLALYLVGPRGLSATTAGVVVACFGAGAFASQPLGGYLADRIGRRATLVAGMVGSAASFVLLAAVRDLWLIGFAALLSGVAVDIYRPAVSALVTDLVRPEHRARAFALLYWVINLGVAVAGITGGYLAARSFWLLFLADAFTCLAFAVLIARQVPETRPERDPTAATGYGPVLRDRLLLGITATMLLGATVYLQSFITLPIAVQADGLGPEAYGFIYAVNPIVVIVSQVFVLRIIDRITGVWLLSASLVVLGIGFGLTAFASTIPFYALTVVIWTIGEVGFNAVGPALVADIAPADMRGRYNGVIGTSWGAAALLAPLIGTRLLDLYGEGVLWGSCLVASVVAAVMIIAMAPAIARRRAANAALPT